jgi:hypothetical protein
VMEFPLPPKPSPSAQPKVELISGPASGLPSPVLSIKNGRNGKQVLEIRCPLSGVADSTPKFSLYDWIKEARKKRTVLNPKWPPMNRPNNPLVYSAVIVSGWHEKNNAVKKYRRIKVTFDSVQIHEDHDPLGQAEWNLYLRANGTWLKAPLPAKVKRGETYPLGRSAEFLIPEEGSVRLQAQGWEADNDRFFRVGTPPDILDSLAKDENEDLGKIEKGFGFPAGFGVGSHIIKSNRSDYTIKVTISETARFP